MHHQLSLHYVGYDRAMFVQRNKHTATTENNTVLHAGSNKSVLDAKGNIWLGDRYS